MVVHWRSVGSSVSFSYNDYNYDNTNSNVSSHICKRNNGQHLAGIAENNKLKRALVGVLSEDWKSDLKKGFKECFRVLKPNGILVFKWNEDQIKVREILKLTDVKPLFGHTTGRHGKTHWITFMKI